MNAEEPMLRLEQVAKAYPTAPEPTVVLKGLDLCVDHGESLAVIGPSGCGKSTLLNLIATLDHPTTGRIVFKGRDLSGLSSTETAQFRNREVGLVFQQHHLLPQCSALENVLVPALVNGEAEAATERAAELLEQVGLAHRMDRRPGQLSGGERQRVAVVRALINEPSLLLADEPTGSLNEDGAERLADLLVELNRERNMALILVTHSRRIAEKTGRVLELHDGVLAG